ncbi:sensor histidine kinase [Lachnospira sp.]|jgi:two-component system phosphate regulon sensor histidine kinase PhoR|uniref:sensor histidine kinase n=1 Tax=Lachnospira sp. TaxID=2049031 RepID=UPI00257BD005|nr:ATP-binding protein [Lachnospira sp.]
MKTKINIRLMIIAIIAIAFTVLGTTLVYYNIFQRQVKNDLAVTAKLLRDTNYFESTDGDLSSMDLSADVQELRITWVDMDGTVLYDNDAEAADLSNHYDRPEIQEAFKNGYGEITRVSDTMNHNTIYYALLLDNGTVLRVATDVNSLFSVFMSATPVIVVIIMTLLLICVLLSHLLTKQLLRPVENMAKNFNNVNYEAPYKELEPLTEIIRAQHDEVLSAAKVRQDFTANISHELKTPLTAISGYAELLEGDFVDEEKRKHFYHEIRKNSNRLLALITDIIRLSELDRSDREPSFEELNLYEIVSECVENLEFGAKQRGVVLSLKGEVCRLRGNSHMLRELAENLIQNAIRYNNPGGKVEVVVTANPEACLIVKDNGIGIPKEDQQRIFERFYRVDKSRSKETGGTGLGLSIVKHVVEIHNAKIELESEPGFGTTMKVVF